MDSYSVPRWLLSNTLKQPALSDVSLLRLDCKVPSVYVLLVGPSGSPYSGGLFTCILKITYRRQVKIRFLTPILHPNVSEDGDYQGILQIPSSATTIQPAFEAILEVLRSPDWSNPHNSALAEKHSKDPEACMRDIKQHTRHWAH